MEGRDGWLTIWKVNRGYVVKRGCQWLVFRNDEHQQMKEAFGDLLENEDKAGQKWCDSYAAGDMPPVMNTVPETQAGSY